MKGIVFRFKNRKPELPENSGLFRKNSAPAEYRDKCPEHISYQLRHSGFRIVFRHIF